MTKKDTKTAPSDETTADPRIEVVGESAVLETAAHPAVLESESIPDDLPETPIELAEIDLPDERGDVEASGFEHLVLPHEDAETEAAIARQHSEG